MDNRVRKLSQELFAGQISRRDFIKRAIALGVSLPMTGAILAACTAEEPTVAPTTAAQPTQAPATAVPPTATPAATAATVIFGGGGDITTLDPHVTVTGVDEAMMKTFYDGLIDWTGELGKFEPALATEWSVGEDQVTWTFKLREGVKFHDGTDFDADVVKFNVDRAMENVGFRWDPYVSEVKVVDKYTVQFITPEPHAGFLDHMSWPLQSFHSIAAFEKHGDDLKSNPVGTGPFIFEEWVPGEQLRFRRNPDYWRTPPQIDEIVYRPIPEYGTRVLALESGDVDMIVNVAVTDVERLRGVEGVQVATYPSVRCMNLIPNLTKEVLSKEVLQALNYAIDRDSICEFVMAGLTQPSYNYVSSVNFGFKIPDPQYTFDPEKAKAMLAEAGVEAGTKLTIMATEGRYYGDRQVAEAVQSMWNNIGLDTELWLVDWPTYAKWMWSVGPDDPNVQRRDFALTDWGTQDPIFAIWAEVTGNWPPDGANTTFTDDDEMENMVMEAWATVDDEERKQILHDLQDHIAENGYRVFIMEQSQVYALKAGVADFRVNPNHHWNFRNIHWA